MEILLRTGGQGSLHFNGYRVSVWDDEKNSGDGYDNDCTTMWIYLIPFNCMFKMVKISGIFTTILKWEI